MQYMVHWPSYASCAHVSLACVFRMCTLCAYACARTHHVNFPLVDAIATPRAVVVQRWAPVQAHSKRPFRRWFRCFEQAVGSPVGPA
jgi:hypothetical protein